MPFLLLTLTACIHDLPWRDTADTGAEEAVAPALAEVAAGTVENGSFLRFDGLIASTGLTRDGRTFFLQTPEGDAGVRVDLAFTGAIGSMSPGDVITLQGYLDTGLGSPRLLVWEPDWLRREAPVEPPAAMSLSLDDTSWQAAAGRPIEVENLTAENCPDDIGDVPLRQGPTLSDRFAPLPSGIQVGSTLGSTTAILVQEWDTWQLWPLDASAVQDVSGGRPCSPDIHPL